MSSVFDFTDLAGTANLSVAANGLVMKEVDLAGDGIHVMTHLQISGSKASGIVYCRVHGIPFGVDLRGEKTDLIFRHPKRWFEAQKTEPGGAGD